MCWGCFWCWAGPDTGATSTGSARIRLTLDFLAWCCRAGWEAHTCARLTWGTLLKRQPQFVSCLLCENHSRVHTQNGSREDSPAPASTPQPLAGQRTHMGPSLPSCSSAAGKAVDVPGTCRRGHEGTAASLCCHPSPRSALPETSQQDWAGKMLPRFVSCERHGSIMPQTGQPLPDSPSTKAGEESSGVGWSIPALCSCPAALCQDQAGWRWASVTHYPCSHPDDTFIASRTGLLPAQQPHGSEAGKRAGSARARRGW